MAQAVTAAGLAGLSRFVELVRERGAELYRDLPWRRTCDAYAVLVSEVMLQQTQVSRVLGRWEEWVERFPSIDSLAAAPLPEVLGRWQGMGYNRRALALKRCAEACSSAGGVLPSDYRELLALPGIGPSTAAGVCVFAYGQQQVYLETNVRAVFLHEFYAHCDKVPDKELVPLVQAACSLDAATRPDGPRTWYYALLDYGAYLKKTVPNPSRRSAHHVRQSCFEGSSRQKRAELLRCMLAQGTLSDVELESALAAFELAAGRVAPDYEEVERLMEGLERDGLVVAAPNGAGGHDEGAQKSWSLGA
ncbi:MAG: adenine glycosylase [Coriobacteriales bacterium]|jgi:A/G-specific adenine glycosylase|nr:adenine glycosylase [Coriobacteriales bacterium]